MTEDDEEGNELKHEGGKKKTCKTSEYTDTG